MEARLESMISRELHDESIDDYIVPSLARNYGSYSTSKGFAASSISVEFLLS